MGDLPQILARPGLPSLELPRTNANAYGAEGFGRLAQGFATMADITQAMKDKEAPIEAAQKISDYNVAANDLKLKIQAEHPDDPLSWRDYYQKEEAALRQQFTSGITDPKVKDAFTLQTVRSHDNHINEITTRGWVASRDKNKMGMETLINDSAREYGSALTDRDRQAIDAKIAGTILSATAPVTVNGRTLPADMTREEATKVIEKYKEMADKERVGWMAVNQPAQLIEAMKDPKQFLTLDTNDRHAATGRANEVITQNRLNADRAEKARLDGVNQNILVQTQQDGADLTKIREDVLKATNLDYTSKNHWINTLNGAIKAQITGEDSPYFKSQGDVLGSVMKGVLETPERWSTTDITRYIGKGLSAKDAENLTNILEKANKGEAGKFSPLAQMRDSWERQLHNGGFLNADEYANYAKKNPAMLAENDRRAQEVMGKVMEAVKKGQDPRTALQTELQPYHHQTVTSWFDSINPWGKSELDQKKDLAAAQYLASRNQDASNPENVKKARAFLERQSAPAKAGARAGGIEGATPPTEAQPMQSVASDLQLFYRKSFGKDLPISALGQSGTHDKLGFDHSNAMDVAIQPDSKEGRALMEYLDSQNIPFIAFSKAKAGVATGPHIHVGAPSPRVVPTVRAGNAY